MNISLTPELEAYIRKKVEAGMYHSSSEVVREALRYMEERDRIRQMRVEELRKEIQKGIDSGPAEPWDPEAMKRRVRERLKKGN